jgi:hypothetical protein
VKKPTIPRRYYTLLTVILVIVGTWLVVASYTPGGAGLERLKGSGDLEVVPYGPKTSVPLVLLGACCYVAAYYFYKHNKD